MTLALLMAALCIVATLWLTRPLWQAVRSSSVGRIAANVAAYDSRLAELKADIAAGVLPAAEAAAVQQEMEARLLVDAASPVPMPVADAGGRAAFPLVLFVLLASFSGLWYWQAGTWEVARQIASAPADGNATAGSPDIEAMVSKLKKRLESQPEDAEGWAMLGRSHFVMGKYAESANSYGKANSTSNSSNAEWLVSEGEALAMSRDRDLLGRPAQLFEAALALQPSYGKALWYGALADAQAGDSARASHRLEMLLAQDLPEELKTMVAQRLDELRNLSESSSASATGDQQTLRQRSKPPDAGSQAGVQLRVEVTLDPSLAERVPGGATLFVFAKAAPLSGIAPPMPLAVQKLSSAKFPLIVTLNDAMAMTPAMTLSQFDRYIVSARLSRSGGALPVPGDLEGSATVARSEAGKILAVSISREVR